MIQEKSLKIIHGFATLPLFIGLGLAGAWGVFTMAQSSTMVGVFGSVFVILVALVGLGGHFVVNPNEGKVLQLFGDYTGTAREPGLRWANPFFTKRAVSLRVRNFETGQLKVNDARANPIEIAAVVVWRVVDTAEAIFEVDDYQQCVHVQSDAAETAGECRGRSPSANRGGGGRHG